MLSKRCTNSHILIDNIVASTPFFKRSFPAGKRDKFEDINGGANATYNLNDEGSFCFD